MIKIKHRAFKIYGLMLMGLVPLSTSCGQQVESNAANEGTPSPTSTDGIVACQLVDITGIEQKATSNPNSVVPQSIVTKTPIKNFVYPDDVKSLIVYASPDELTAAGINSSGLNGGRYVLVINNGSWSMDDLPVSLPGSVGEQPTVSPTINWRLEILDPQQGYQFASELLSPGNACFKG